MRGTQVTRGYGLLERFLSKQRSKKANSLIPDNMRQGRVLDIGCGTTPVFLLETTFAERYGIDKVVPAEVRDSEVAGLVLRNHDVEASQLLPFHDEYFDVVTMLAVFEHIAPAVLTNILSEIHRILKPGGLYVLTTPAPWTPLVLQLLAKLHMLSPLEIEEHKDAYSHAAIGSLLAQAGFTGNDLTLGYFEMGMNVWGCARKTQGHNSDMGKHGLERRA